MGLPGKRKPITFVEDTAVSPEHLSTFVAEFQQIVQRHGTYGAIYGHASVGCLHIRPVLDLSQQSDVQTMRQISDEVSSLVLKYQGSLSGEHGDGLARSEWLPKMFGSEIYDAFRQVKQACDPDGLFNPGKIVSPQQMDQQLRYQPASLQKSSLPTLAFDYSEEGGIRQHIELCSGTGVCRRTSVGTMCPSYRATLDERDSTRGRANILRLAFQQHEPLDALALPEVKEVLDLCLACKACKAECPSNVDMAKLKAEVLQQYYQHHRRALSDRIQRFLPSYLKLGSNLAPVVNKVGKWRLVRWALDRWGGLARGRSLPVFHFQHFRRWFRKHQRLDSVRKVLLWDDCFTTYTEPEIGQAAVQLIESTGTQVELVEPICCGRPLISKGYLTQAKLLIQKQAARLAERISDDKPLLGLEPSCLLTLVDDWPQLLPGDATKHIARHARMLESWLMHQSMEYNPLQQPIVVHGHCHQKALVGMDDTIAALRMIPQSQVTLLDTGCCGMAGSFGYEKEHYALSQQIALQSWLPLFKPHPAAIVTATGTSCRHQWKDTTSQTALHPIKLLAEQVKRVE